MWGAFQRQAEKINNLWNSTPYDQEDQHFKDTYFAVFFVLVLIHAAIWRGVSQLVEFGSDRKLYREKTDLGGQSTRIVPGSSVRSAMCSVAMSQSLAAALIPFVFFLFLSYAEEKKPFCEEVVSFSKVFDPPGPAGTPGCSEVFWQQQQQPRIESKSLQTFRQEHCQCPSLL
jgi:hypothetical protein